MFWKTSPSINFDPDQDIGDLKGKVIIVTGGNDGLGKETVLRLAKHNPECIFLCSRSVEKGETAVKEIETAVPGANIRLLKLDLGSLASVSAAVSTFREQYDKLDILINNAGIANLPPGKTVEGYEQQFGVNHIGHALLIKLLLPTMLKTAEIETPGSVRIVSVSSEAHEHIKPPGINFDDLEKAGHPWLLYAQSKLANLLYAKALAKQYPSIVSVSLHPGTAKTGIFVKMDTAWINMLMFLLGWTIMGTIEQTAKNQLWAATAIEVQSGAYYTPVGVKNAGTALSNDEELENKLWGWTQGELKKQNY
ncbi:NAD(P)-binding protein [Microthyrium microscopicum]|uniref:NAD(P)-binding protein n=1 Tax=Microthyrium microscopicum TaxID=703497 RepID=A0A6A6TZX5_9PEZI|nr:NAD(P)-binding protein [Microthyrium microscopicum]